MSIACRRGLFVEARRVSEGRATIDFRLQVGLTGQPGRRIPSLARRVSVQDDPFVDGELKSRETLALTPVRLSSPKSGPSPSSTGSPRPARGEGRRGHSERDGGTRPEDL